MGLNEGINMKQKKSIRFLSDQKSFRFLTCPICRQEGMEKKKDVMEQDGVSFDAYVCPKCGEEIMTMPQLKVLAAKYRRLRQAKEITFAKWGNSLAVRIPSEIVEELNLSEGKQGTLMRDKEGIKIVPVV